MITKVGCLNAEDLFEPMRRTKAARPSPTIGLKGGLILHWDIAADGVSSKAVNPVRVGDARESVREVLGTFRTVKGPYGPEVDQFVGHGVQVTYDGESRALEIVLTVPDQARFLGVELLGRPIEAVLTDLRACGLEAVRDVDGALLPTVGVSLYAVEDRVESVTVGYPPVE